MDILSHGLIWIGTRARWILPIGCLAALLLPGLSEWFRPALPFLVALVLMLAMVRIDLLGTFRRNMKPVALVRLIGLTLLLMPVTGGALWVMGWLVGLPPEWRDLLIIFAAAPPIPSAAALCFLLGLDAAFAVTLTVFAVVLTPILGPLTIGWFLSTDVSIAPIDLAGRLGLIILGGALAALLIQATVGRARLMRNGSILDGVGAIAMVLFVLPLFDGTLDQIVSAPLVTLGVLAFVFALNWGMNLMSRWPALGYFTRPEAGSLGVMGGNRTVAIYAASLPHDPFVMLFIAFYQFPMFLTPLMFRSLSAADSGTKDGS